MELESLKELGPSTFPAPGFIGERHFFFEVVVAPEQRSEPSLDGSALEHFGQVVAIPLGEALEHCRSGLIVDAKTEPRAAAAPREGAVSGPRVVVVAKRTPYQHYVEDERDPRVQALLKRRDPAVRSWQSAHKEHARTLETVLSVLERERAKVMLLRGAQAVFDPADAEIVVVVGGDGTMLAASHSVGGVPVLGVNSAPGTASASSAPRSEAPSRRCSARRSRASSAAPR